MQHRRALLIADDPALYTMLAESLRPEGLPLIISPLAEEAIALCRLERPSVLLLDENVGGGKGLSVCRNIHGCPDLQDIPILLLSRGGAEADRLAAFTAGATDCLTAPVSVAELVARIRVQLRSHQFPGVEQSVVHGALRLEPGQHRASLHGRRIFLSPTEFHLLKLLMTRPGQVFHRRELLMAVWGTKPDITPRVLDTFIRRLRAKLDGGEGWIRSVRGIGYLFGEPDAAIAPSARLDSPAEPIEKEHSW